MKNPQTRVRATLALLPTLFVGQAYGSAPPPVSDATEECIGCHDETTPGIVADWRRSAHARTTPANAMKKPAQQRRISAERVPETLNAVAVGCFECHGLNKGLHLDNFDHEGHDINVIVTPDDCRTCHPEEVTQYSRSKKAHAVDNLLKNRVYTQMVETLTRSRSAHQGRVTRGTASEANKRATCLACHGTHVTVRGMKTITLIGGDTLQVPDLGGWPNHGVGRMNPDGSLGACTSCHPRHGFSIEVARKPHTCAQCHLAPDAPAWEVYQESKHGNLYASQGSSWRWDTVPWKLGEDFHAPTCASCHNALVADPSGAIVAPRTHDFGQRLWVRIFGLPYAHPQPMGGATHMIMNADGLPLPVTFDGRPASEYLIDAMRQERRKTVMLKICGGCHSSDFAYGHFRALDESVKETNDMTLAATTLLQQAWSSGVAHADNPFDEPFEHKWVRHWLFYATSSRYAAAMGGPDYASFKNGWWNLTENLAEMIGQVAHDEAARHLGPAKE